MKTENILLFPTLVTLGKREVDELEKESWFSAYLEQSDKDGVSNESTGHQSVHHDIRFKRVFSDIADTIRKHLTTLGVDTNMIEVYIQKSFFNVKKNNGNPQHNHKESHISFTYYPYIHESRNQQLVFYQDKDKVGNDIYEEFLDFNVKEWHNINATNYSLPVVEGNIFVFPSKLAHGVNSESEIGDSEYFKTIEELKLSRFCVVGDVVLTRKDTKSYDRLLMPIDNWRKF